MKRTEVRKEANPSTPIPAHLFGLKEDNTGRPNRVASTDNEIKVDIGSRSGSSGKKSPGFADDSIGIGGRSAQSGKGPRLAKNPVEKEVETNDAAGLKMNEDFEPKRNPDGFAVNINGRSANSGKGVRFEDDNEIIVEDGLQDGPRLVEEPKDDSFLDEIG